MSYRDRYLQLLPSQAFFPKNRGNWKQFSSFEPEAKAKREKKTIEDNRFPQDVEVKKGHSWSDQVGIAIAALVEAGQTELVYWTKDVCCYARVCVILSDSLTQILTLVSAQRQRIIEEVDNIDDEAAENGEDATAMALRLKEAPSTEAMAKLTDYRE